MTDYLNRGLTYDEYCILAEHFKRGVKVEIPRQILAESNNKLFQTVMMEGKGIPRYELWIKDLREERPHYVIVAISPAAGTEILYSSKKNDPSVVDSLENIAKNVEQAQKSRITGRIGSNALIGSLLFGLMCLYGSFLITLPMSKAYLEARSPGTAMAITAFITSIFMIPTLLVYFMSIRAYTPQALAGDATLRLTKRYLEALEALRQRPGGVNDLEI